MQIRDSGNSVELWKISRIGIEKKCKRYCEGRIDITRENPFPLDSACEESEKNEVIASAQ